MGLKYKLYIKEKEHVHYWIWIYPKNERYTEIIKQHPSLLNRGGCVVLCEGCNSVTTST